MVVHQDYGRSAFQDRRPEYLAWMDQGGIEDPPGHEDIPQHTMLSVEQ